MPPTVHSPFLFLIYFSFQTFLTNEYKGAGMLDEHQGLCIWILGKGTLTLFIFNSYSIRMVLLIQQSQQIIQMLEGAVLIGVSQSHTGVTWGAAIRFAYRQESNANVTFGVGILLYC